MTLIHRSRQRASRLKAFCQAWARSTYHRRVAWTGAWMPSQAIQPAGPADRGTPLAK